MFENMDNNTKVNLSPQELELACNREFILTKRIITSKAYDLFGHLGEEMKKIIKAADIIPETVKTSSPQIYKGENYREFPYVLLDYPHSFNKEDVFTIRTMFWWGNFFSITLQLSGKYKAAFEEAVIKNIRQLHNRFAICVNDNQWQHHWEADNYLLLNKTEPAASEKIIREKSFLKVAAQHPLQQWDHVHTLLLNDFSALIDCLKN